MQWDGCKLEKIEGYVPGGNWVTVGYRFPPGPSSKVHLGRQHWKGKIKNAENGLSSEVHLGRALEHWNRRECLSSFCQ